MTLAIFTGACALEAQTPGPLITEAKQAYSNIKNNLLKMAEKMPEENYSFKPTPDVRSFGEILAHVAGASYVFCAAAKGEKSPFDEEHFEKNAKTREAIIKATGDAIAYCDGAFTALTDATAGQMVAAPFGSNQIPRTAALVGQIGHDNEHYGNLVTYFRLKGLVPPSSKRQ